MLSVALAVDLAGGTSGGACTRFICVACAGGPGCGIFRRHVVGGGVHEPAQLALLPPSLVVGVHLRRVVLVDVRVDPPVCKSSRKVMDR